MRGGVQRRRVLHALEDAALLAPAHERAVVPGAHQVAKRLRERERGHDSAPVPVQSLERSARALVPALDQPAPATGPQLRASVRRARHRRVVRAREDARRHERHRRDRANRECASDRPRTMTRPGPRHLLDLRLRPKTPDNLRRPNRVGGSGSAATELCVTIDRAFRHAPGAREASALGRGGGERQDVRARQGQPRVFLQGVPGERDLRAREAATPVQGVRGLGHLRAREAAKPLQGVRGREHLRAREGAKLLQGVRGLGHLRAREAAKPVQGVRGGAICEHGRQRPQCKQCGGSGICEHGRERRFCKECGGGSICEHGRLRSKCKECRAARDAAAPVLYLPVQPKPEILVELEDVEDPGEDDEGT